MARLFLAVAPSLLLCSLASAAQAEADAAITGTETKTSPGATSTYSTANALTTTSTRFTYPTACGVTQRGKAEPTTIFGVVMYEKTCTDNPITATYGPNVVAVTTAGLSRFP
ncbi:hypothetical protein BD626DRAFT_568254 [Schizophyllum amplum]|uniref:Uncharacterized protein n=1 Tax=Schizophyllum amplum TaxID=97359 RepID=A0A550CI78_9AGAR|nr:hypothetical protein BD626DRAFT_568254 [Auriculariopsis ampla]